MMLLTFLACAAPAPEVAAPPPPPGPTPRSWNVWPPLLRHERPGHPASATGVGPLRRAGHGPPRRPVAGATIVVSIDAFDTEQARARDGCGGAVPPRDPPERGSAAATAPGYTRWALTPGPGTCPSAWLLLRPVPTIVAELASVTTTHAPEERLWSALELVGVHAVAYDVDSGVPESPTSQERWEDLVYPRIGDMRPELRAIAGSDVFSPPDAGRESPAERARALLVEWGRPRRCGPAPAPAPHPDMPAIQAPSIEALCSAYADTQFAVAPYGPANPPPPNVCYGAWVFNGGTQGRITLYVTYTHWSYALELAARRENDIWHLWRVRETSRYTWRIEQEERDGCWAVCP